MEIIVIILVIIMILLIGIEKYLKNEKKQINIDNMNLQKKDYIFSNTELIFYKKLRNITNEFNLVVFPKIRLIDILKTNEKSLLNEIELKYIDYLICDQDNYKIKLGIELDYYIHKQEIQKQDDEFKNKIFETIGIKLIRVKISNFYNLEELERQIKEAL